MQRRGNNITERIFRMEEALKLYGGRMDGFGREIKILLSEVNIITNWIYQHFNVQLINKKSAIFKTIHDYEDVEELSLSLSLLANAEQIAKAKGKFIDRQNVKSASTSTVNSDIVHVSTSVNKEPGPRCDEICSNIYGGTDVASSTETNCATASIRRSTRNNSTVLTLWGEKSSQKPTENSNEEETTLENRGIETEESLSKDSTPEDKPEEDPEVPKRGRQRKQGAEKADNWKKRAPVQCDECGKVLKGAGSLRVHKATHSNFRPFKCDQCGKAFRMKHHLDFHILVHSGDKKECCTYCGKSFLVKRDLLRHERTHTGEKPYSCQYCPKTFNVKQHLTLHIRIHTGERPYNCMVCHKTFTQANSLRIHKKIHSKNNVDKKDSGGSSLNGSLRVTPREIKSLTFNDATTCRNENDSSSGTSAKIIQGNKLSQGQFETNVIIPKSLQQLQLKQHSM